MSQLMLSQRASGAGAALEHHFVSRADASVHRFALHIRRRLPRSTCASCGVPVGVDEHLVGEAAFCGECWDHSQLDEWSELYDDLGGGG